LCLFKVCAKEIAFEWGVGDSEKKYDNRSKPNNETLIVSFYW
jgi:hypothetical protein